MANCTTCNAPVGFFEKLIQRGTGRCRNCNKKFFSIQKYFYQIINNAVQTGNLSLDAENTILQDVRVSELPEDLKEQIVTELRLQRKIITHKELLQSQGKLQKELLQSIEHHFNQRTLSHDIEMQISSQASTLPQALSAAVLQKLQNLRQKELLQSIEHHFNQRTLSHDIETQISSQASTLPYALSAPVLQRLQYLRNITEIQRGNIPRIQTSIHLDSDEYAHFEMRVTYYKPNQKIKEIAGRLIGTNKKCYFISDSGSDSATIDWNNVSEVREQSLRLARKTKVGTQTVINYQDVQVLHFSVTKGSGGGGYSVSDRYYTKILIDTIVRMWKRQLVIYAEIKNQGAVPEHVKSAVFARDGGKCVQCGYEGPYIEYDHRIPRSKGGPNTVENIQLLCRMCNLKKGNRL